MGPTQQTQQTVDFSSDKLIFYYTDINKSNFLITKTGELCVIDFQDAGFLPESFMSFVLHKTSTTDFIKFISDKIACQKSNNLPAMNRASYLIKISGGNIGKNG